jgi:hypothetical protein
LQAHYNIAPTDTVDVVRPADSGATELVSLRWELIPSCWKKPVKQLPATFNARADSVAHKPIPGRATGWRLIAPFPIDDIPERPAVEIGAQIVAEEIDGAMTVLITGSRDMRRD